MIRLSVGRVLGTGVWGSGEVKRRDGKTVSHSDHLRNV